MPSELKVNKLSPYTGSTLTIGDSGDTISFASGVLPSLESLTITGDLTVDTDTLYVDSSNNRLGVGTTSPFTIIDARQTSTGGSTEIRVYNTDNSNTTTQTASLFLSPDSRSTGALIFAEKENADFSTNADRDVSLVFSPVLNNSQTEAMRIDSSGNVGIGTTSPLAAGSSYTVLDIGSSSTASLLNMTDNGTETGRIVAESNQLHLSSGTASGFIGFRTGGFSSNDEAMRIDSSGNLLVGKTSADSGATVGTEINSNNTAYFTRSGTAAVVVNRTTSHGSIAIFRKDGSTVGIIGNGVGTTTGIDIDGISGYVGINTDDNGNGGGIKFLARTFTGAPRVIPVTDNFVDLGHSSNRYDDVYATNGTIQTSDQNEKQSIQSLTASEITVAKRISKLFKTYKWNSAVEEKGDNARTHTGVIAQEVQQAFSDEGLDASNYALFISSTWWEKEIPVDAVVEELDEEGNIIVEGKDAYTYIDTKDEATEGYTERTRLGIRYPELLSFVSSAFEQRLTNIETRLETLENT